MYNVSIKFPMQDLSRSQSPSNVESFDLPDINRKLISGECKIIQKTGKSKVWEIFGKVEFNGKIIPNVVACSMCYAVLNFQVTTSNLTRHKCFKKLNKTSSDAKTVDVDQDTKTKVMNVITRWTIKNCRPFEMVQDYGLMQYSQILLSIGAEFGANVDIHNLLPHPTTVSGNIDQLYNESYDLLKTEIDSIKNVGFSITADIWTDDHVKTSYLAVTIHYIKNANVHKKLLAMESKNAESCTNESLLRNVASILDNFNLSIDKAIIVTDKGSSMKDALSPYNRIYSISRLLENIVEECIKEVPTIHNLCKKCIKLIAYFNKSGCDPALSMSLKNYTPTRWSTLYFSLKSIQQNWVEIGKTLQQNKQHFRISGIDLTILKQTINTLKPIVEALNELEEDSYPTLHMVIIHIHHLKRLYEMKSEDVDCVRQLHSNLGISLCDTVLANLTIYHRIALFLFPPTNKLTQFTNGQKDEMKAKMKRMIENFENDLLFVNSKNIKLEPLPAERQSLFAEFLNPSEYINIEQKISSELAAYENVYETLHNNFNVLQWWDLNKIKFPLLYKLSCHVLGIPASSAASERIFSKAGNLLSGKHCPTATNPDTVGKIMFLHENNAVEETFENE